MFWPWVWGRGNHFGGGDELFGSGGVTVGRNDRDGNLWAAIWVCDFVRSRSTFVENGFCNLKSS